MKELINIVIVGHVDHGKSTLVGRLLYDTNSLPTDKYEKVKRICREQGKAFEYAFLLDAFEEEQKQGITIDVARIRFSTKRRDYVIIDTPGHKEFLKNMFSGASSADIGILLIDAAEGVQEQSKQHAYLLHLLGIEHIIVVINKMDLVEHSRKVFTQIKREYAAYAKTLSLTIKAFVPVVAQSGCNIFKRHKKMQWYKGHTVCELLDAVYLKKHIEKRPLRIFVQDIYKFDQKRIIAGRIESGEIHVGDEILFSPGNRVGRVKSIEVWPSSKKKKISAHNGESIALTLESQLFVERGQILSHAEHPPYLANEFEATMFWLGNEPLQRMQGYHLRLGTQDVECRIEKIKTIISAGGDYSSGGEHINRYDAAEIIIKTKKPIAFDDFSTIQETGRFVIIDHHVVSGGGRALLGAYPNLRESGNDVIKSKNISWHFSKVTNEERQLRYKHKGAVIWLTGLSGSGKSTIATELEKKLFNKGIHVFVLDGDNIRHGLNANLGFSPDDRAENIRRIGEVAKLFAEAGFIVITAFISPYTSGRDMMRKRVGEKFIEVYLNCPLSVCEKRDSKGLYKKARAGELQEFTGISAPYESPQHPEILIRTDTMSIEKSVQRIVAYLKKKSIAMQHTAVD
ncbi:MAG: adenylyl-sulfate kinase [Candidatus Omnitrophica bacterium]|nr:adenylyl-sulfate kinase [Candidatus Omnitrophota bacterium]